MAKQRRVLVIDDDPDVGERLTQLGDAELDFVVLADANQALARLKAEAWDLLLVDINLLIFRGDRLVKALKQRAQGKRPPILFFSAEDDARLAALVRETGVEGYVGKSARNADLLAKLRAHLPA